MTFGNLGYGIDCNDNASSSGYIMYSEESVFTRFSANPPAANNARNFVCVRYAAGVWSYHTGGSSNILVPFPTRPTDVLIASVNYTTDTFTMLENQTGTYGGLSKGYGNSNITLVAKQWNGSPDNHNFQITVGSYFYRNFTLIQRSTYSLDGTPIATRVSGDTVSGNNGLFYLFTDHLGSSAFMTTSSGTLVSGSTARYKPFGGYRTTPSQTITDRGFTGHLHNDSVGLVYMNARFYLPGVGRFASADTIVPEPINPQDFNRYSYVGNNPLLYNDPTGHYRCTGGSATENADCETNIGMWLDDLKANGGDIGYGIYLWFMELDAEYGGNFTINLFDDVGTLQGAIMFVPHSDYDPSTQDLSLFLNKNFASYGENMTTVLGHETVHLYQQNRQGILGPLQNLMFESEAFYFHGLLLEELHKSSGSTGPVAMTSVGHAQVITLLKNEIATGTNTISGNTLLKLRDALIAADYPSLDLIHYTNDIATIRSTQAYFTGLGASKRAAESCLITVSSHC